MSYYQNNILWIQLLKYVRQFQILQKKKKKKKKSEKLKNQMLKFPKVPQKKKKDDLEPRNY